MRKRNLDKSAQRKWAQTPKSLGVLLMVLVLLLAACQPSADPTQEPTPVSGAEPTQAESAPEGEVSEPQAPVDQNPDLVGTPWVLVMYGEPASPTVVEAGTVVTAVFAADESLTGSAGCNNYSTTYQVSGDQLTVNSPMAVTAMACEAGMEQEAVYLGALETAQSYEINAQGSLVIAYQGGALVYIAQRAPLVRTLWTLATMGPVDNPQVPVAGANFTATFQRSGGAPTGLVSGATGCNEYAASYFAGLNQLKINLPSTTGNTDCAAGLAEQEQEYYRALFAARDYRILGDRLQVSYDSNVLTFIATPEGAPEAGALTPLNGTKWWYISSDTQIRIPETEITAEFAINPDGTTGTMSGFAGCNTYSFEIMGVYQLGSPVVTKTFCENPPGVMEQEVAYLAALESAISITYSAEEVRISTASGTVIYSSTQPVEALPPIAPTGEPTSELPLTPTVEATPGEPIEPTTEAPTAIINGPTEGVVGQPLTYNASGSSSSIDIVQYLWDFGDGNTGEGVTIDHTYGAAGDYTLLLTVVDSNGGTGQASIVVSIQAAG